MRAITHPATVAFGLANLYLLSLTGPLISSGHDLVYHLTGSALVIFIPILIYLLALSFALAILFGLAERPGRFRIIVWSAAALALPWILTETFAGFFDDAVPGWISLLIGLASLLVFVAIATWKRLQPAFEAVQPFAATVFGCFALCGVAILLQLMWFGWQSRDLNPPPSLHRLQSAPAPARQRIIWIVLDELSYQQVYERRFPGLQLPAFDQLAAQSTIFTNVVPAGMFTRQVIPSLFTGLPADRVSISGAGLLSALHDTATGTWVPFDQHNTVFQDAIDDGYTTGVAGWYNPYCRILPEVLDHCYWTYREDIPARLSSRQTVAANLAEPFRLMAREARHLLGGPGVLSDDRLDLLSHSADYRNLLDAGDALLDDPSINFLFIHMPVPHPLGFYDRESGQFSSHHTSYIDNLALADRYLGHVRALLEQKGQWDSATVVVMGDHSWRTSMIWHRSAGWSDEDHAASHGGQFDPRPGYIVKLPSQHTAARLDERFPAIRTRALLDAMLSGRLQTPEQLQQGVPKP